MKPAHAPGSGTFPDSGSQAFELRDLAVVDEQVLVPGRSS